MSTPFASPLCYFPLLGIVGQNKVYLFPSLEAKSERCGTHNTMFVLWHTHDVYGIRLSCTHTHIYIIICLFVRVGRAEEEMRGSISGGVSRTIESCPPKCFIIIAVFDLAPSFAQHVFAHGWGFVWVVSLIYEHPGCQRYGLPIFVWNGVVWVVWAVWSTSHASSACCIMWPGCSILLIAHIISYIVR